MKAHTTEYVQTHRYKKNRKQPGDINTNEQPNDNDKTINHKKKQTSNKTNNKQNK